MFGRKANGYRLSICFRLTSFSKLLATLNNVGKHQKQDGCRETGSGNILDCARDTCEIVVLIHKPVVLTDTVKLLSASTDIDRHRNKMAINKPEVMYELHDRHVPHIQRHDQLTTTSASSYAVMFCSFSLHCIMKTET